MALYNNDDMKVGPLNSDYTRGYLDGKKAGATAEAKELDNILQWFFDCRRVLIHCESPKEIRLHWEQWKETETTITPDHAATLLHPPDDNSPKGMAEPAADPFTVKKEVGDE